MIATPGESAAATEQSAIAKARRKLLPFMFVLYVVAYLDRINVGFASLEMNRELGLSDAVFGFGAGLFFIGYFIFEIPSNLILARVGARRWIARIMVSWGIAAMAMALVRGEASFYAVRFILGAAEAGFFPGIILYLTFWFPRREQARAVATFMTATAAAGVLAGPTSGPLLALHGFAGLSGWQWLFIVEGLPSVVLGFVVLRWLPDGPAEARWLAPEEREALSARLALDAGQHHTARVDDLSGALRSGRVWILAAIYFGIVVSLYGVSMWLPQIIKRIGAVSDIEVGLISMLPFAAAAVSMVLIGRSSDRRGERTLHLAGSAFTGAIGFAVAAATDNPVVALAAICLAAAGMWGCFGPFWAMPPRYLAGSAAAGGIALINSVGNLGGFVGPYAVGFIKQQTHSFAGGLALLAASLVAAGCLALALTRLEDSA